MTSNVRRLLGSVLIALVFLIPGFAPTPVFGAVEVQEPGRFDRVILFDPSSRIGTVAESPQDLPGYDAERAGWQAFETQHGGGWRVWLDRRSGAPTLVEGPGIRWLPADAARGASAADLEAMARTFLAEHEVLFKVGGSELSLNPASGPMDADHWVLVFDRKVDGVPVEDERVIFYVTRGNLVAFGADRWGHVGSVPAAVYGADTAREVLYLHMGILPSDRVELLEPGTQVLVPAKADLEVVGPYRGPVGGGISFHLAWRFVLRVAGERGTWVGKVDAVTGEVIAFYDDDKYAQVKGGVFPVSNDGDCAELGCEVTYPMPYANLSINASGSTANDMGMFECGPDGATATTTLAGPYVRISDTCGPVNQSVVCDEDLDLGVSGGTDCALPPGGTGGDTHSARSNFYHLNRVKEKVRYYLPSNTWVNQQVTANVNVNATCNASWNGSTNMYKSGGGCANTGELAGVVNHELGHGIDQNDGGGYDNSSETYADVIAILQERRSCVGRNFRPGVNCGGYGDTCLDCTGIRDKDWDKRVQHTPATPANFIGPNCGSGSGPCGRQVHCESYPPSEAIWDLAARDLPASGLDAASSWQLTEKLFYKSRQGSGGNTHNCSLPNSDGCGAGTWFTKLRNADDDDGNLNNGTPHAAAIFAAFNRHALACGQAGDASNQSSSSCPSLATPVIGAAAGSESANLSWAPVSGAARYLILRSDVSCDYSANVVATVDAPATSYTDVDLPNDFPLHYRVQAQAANAACESRVSDCETTTPQPFAGSIKLDRGAYSCSGVIALTVRDANIGSPTTTVSLFSGSEATPETVALTEIAAGSAKYVGTIQTTGGPSGTGDGLLRIAHGDTITARYLDADDGLGGTNLFRQTTAAGDCVAPAVSLVQVTGITDTAATVSWATDEASTSIVRWGEARPPANTTSNAGLVTSHSVGLSGLQACTVYYYSVESQDAPGNAGADDSGGAFFHFETQGNFGDGLQPCHSGRLSLTQSFVGCSQSLGIKVVDLDLNTNPLATDTVTVTVTSSTETTPEVVTLTESGPNTSQFVGGIPTSPNPPAAGNGLLEARQGDQLTAAYDDADDGSGNPGRSFKTALADCASPELSSVRVTDLTDDSGIVRWTTSEGATSRVDWGATPALGSTVSDAALLLNHALTVRPLAECGRFYFRVTSTDVHGNTRVYDAGGSPFEFNVSKIPGIFRDNFETNTGWTLEGEWQIDTPQGRGSAPPDPAQAFTPAKVLGHDLTGLGAHPGDYESGGTQRAISPVINASSLSGSKIKFRRSLNTAPGSSYAYIEVFKNNIWNIVWTSGALGNSESAWSLQTVDISQFADGNAGMKIAFRQNGGFAGGNRSGWNIDRLVVKDSTTPDFDACGGCGGAPTFAGATGASDVNGCADTGVALTWKAAPAWGTGRAGSYSVYRDTNPAFTPSAGNRIATGVAGTAYTDAAAPNGVTLYYIVRAENDETCSSGPNNAGVTDANLLRLSARDDTAQPAPGGVQESVRVDGVNHAHVRLTWVATGTASSYHVYRAQSPQGPFTQIANVAGTTFDDQDQFADTANRYYRVQAADSCGNEGP